MTTHRDDPRKYQLEVARRAIEGNVIAVSDTGSGKTLISVILLKHMVAQARQQAEETGCQVPLVFQQHAYILNNSDIKAEAICGAMGADNYDEDRWNRIFEEFEAVVTTGQILLNILVHAFLKIDLCSIFIFDECHHATGKHCYRQIMTHFYPEANERPKIFGMTASPPKDKGSQKFAANELEKTMDAQIITASYDEVLTYIQRPKERVVNFSGDKVGSGPNSPEAIAFAFSRLTVGEQRICKRLTVLLGEDKKFKPAVLWYEHAMIELGPWFGAMVWKYALQTLRDDIKDTTGPARQSRLEAITAAEQIALSMESSPLSEDLSQVTHKVQKLVEVLREAGREAGFCGILFVERRPTAHVMKEFLEECKRFGPEFGLDFIQAAVLTGHGTKGDVTQQHMDLKEQRKILEGFRKGQFNLLVATDVAEEGLDIDRCRLVIRFDVKNTVISHIQSRGRARDPNSEYIIMLQEGDGYLTKIKEAEADMRRWCGELPRDRVIRLRGLSANGGYDNDDGDDDDEDPNFGLEELRELAGAETTFKVESTGARVNFLTAVSLLYQYCASLPADSYTQLMPEFVVSESAPLRGDWQCWLTLPPNAPVIDFHAGPFSKKTLPKRAAAFLACKELYRLGALTERLLPHRRKNIVQDDLDEDEDEDPTGKGVQGSLRSYPIRQPVFWEDKIKIVAGSHSVALYATLFTLRSSPTDGAEGDSNSSSRFRSLCLLTAAPLPQIDPIELFFDGDPRPADLTNLGSRIDLPVQKVQTLYRYHIQLFATLFHKPVEVGSLETGVRHLVVPLLRHHAGPGTHKDLPLELLVDWEEVQSGAAFSSSKMAPRIQDTDFSWDRLQDVLLFERGQMNRFYYPTALRTDLTPNSLIPTTTSSSTGHDIQTRESDLSAANSTFAQFYKAKREIEIRDLDQPLIEVKKMPKRADHLQSIKKSPPGPKSSAVRFLIPELGQKCPISASVLRSADWMVSALVRVDDLLKTTEFLSEFGLLGQVKVPLMLEALTATETSYTMNYQRLELLGDTFLKFMMAVDLYIRFPLRDEGWLTMKRTAKISNSHLFKRSRLFHLDRFLVKLPPVNTHFFVPVPDADVDTDQPIGSQAATTAIPPPKRKSQVSWEISTKTMADLVESTLGAAFLSGGLDLGLKAAAALLTPLEGIHCWADFARTFSESSASKDPLHPNTITSSSFSLPPFKPDPLLGDLRKIEASIGYRFRNIRLLVEALTHATTDKPQTPCYQRLEFLGDSILDMLVANYWAHRYPVSGPGVLHEIKSASINNQTLGVLCIQLGLHRHILHASSILGNDINRAVQQINDAKEEALSTGTTTARGEPVGEYWHEFNLTKVLGDVLESVFGAVYVDSGWDFAVVQDLFDRAVLPTLRDHISIKTLTRHPVVVLLHRVQKAGCQAFRLRNLAVVMAEEPASSQPPSSSPPSSLSPPGSVPLSSSYSPLTTPSPPTPTLTPTPKPTHQPSGPYTQPPSYQNHPHAHAHQQQQQQQEADHQVCAVLIHGQPAVTASHIQIQVARKEAAKRALALLDADPTWLDRFCTCSTRLKSIRLEGSTDAPSASPPTACSPTASF
ncbi:Dicer-like protein 1 [Mortierella sp. AD031]|nr:Dicer-like protein 1 [Mortierella sp. AD031]